MKTLLDVLTDSFRRALVLAAADFPLPCKLAIDARAADAGVVFLKDG